VGVVATRVTKLQARHRRHDLAPPHRSADPQTGVHSARRNCTRSPTRSMLRALRKRRCPAEYELGAGSTRIADAPLEQRPLRAAAA
jgi:hypothetical protein